MRARERCLSRLTVPAIRFAAASVLVFSASGALAGQGGPIAAEDDCGDDAIEMDGRDLVTLARLSVVDAIAAAEQHTAGDAVEAELEGCQGAAGNHAWFEIALMDDGALREVRVDASNGDVIGTAEDDHDGGEFAGYARALRHSELSLEQLIASAQAVLNGTLVEAELEFDEGQPVAELLFANGPRVDRGRGRGKSGTHRRDRAQRARGG